MTYFVMGYFLVSSHSDMFISQKMDALPLEIVSQIYHECTPPTRLVLSQTSHYFLSITIKDELLTSLVGEYTNDEHHVCWPETRGELVVLLAVSYGSIGLLRHFSGSQCRIRKLIFEAVLRFDSEVLDYIYRRGMRSELIRTTIAWRELVYEEFIVSSPDVLTYCIKRGGMSYDSDLVYQLLEYDYLETYEHLHKTGVLVPEDEHADQAASFGNIRIVHYLTSNGYNFVNPAEVLKAAMNYNAIVLTYLVKICGFKVNRDKYLDVLDFCNYTEEEAYDEVKKICHID